MSLVQIVDSIVPDVWSAYESNATTEKSALYQSGVITPNANMSAKLTMGGKLFQTPFWKDLGNDEGNIGTDDPEDQAVPKKITASKHQFIRQVRTQSWSTADLTAEMAGSDPAQEIAKKVGAYWGRQIDRTAIATIKGITLDNIANDASDMVYDITGTAGTVVVGGRTVNACTMHDLAFIDAKQTMGDMSSVLNLVIMHSVVYTSYLCGPGVIGWAEKALPRPVASKRDELGGNGMGIDTMVHRKQYALHPGGYTFTDNSTALEFPTNTELALATNWDRVLPERKMIPLVVMKTKNG